MKTAQQILFVALITVFGNNFSSAQIALGLKGGANFSTVYTTEALNSLTPDFKYATGATAGFVTEINFNRFFALQP